jgi:hypothetical protein
VEELALKLAWLSRLSDKERWAMGAQAAAIVNQWGPDRFAAGFLEALELARQPKRKYMHMAIGKNETSL